MNTSRTWFVPACIARAGLVLLSVFGIASKVEAQLTSDQINQQVWARIYGVSAAQLGSPAWLAADDDKDGQTNGQELAAGTDPFQPGSVIKITSVATDAANSAYWDLNFLTQGGKQYVAQGKVTLADASWGAVTDAAPAVTSLIGDGNARKLIVAKAGAQGFKYFRVLVQDTHSDGDSTGASDWAKRQSGLDPKNKYSNKQTDAYGAPLDDRTYLSNNLNATQENLVTISTRFAESTATQPDAGSAATDSGSFTITRGGVAALLKPITVNLTVSGTAVSGQDYSGPLPSSVSFLAGQTTQTILVTPITPPSPRPGSITVTATLAAGTGYTIPASNLKTATVVIYPTVTPTGAGLAGTYYKTASTTYSNSANFNAAQVGLTRTDAQIDFANSIASISTGNPCTVTTLEPHGLANGNSVIIGGVSGGTFAPTINATYAVTVTGSNTFTVPVNCTAGPTSLTTSTIACNGWGTLTGPVGMVGETDGVFSVRWTGQIQPQYSELYTFFVSSNDGSRLRINNVDVIGNSSGSNWFSSTGGTETESFGSIVLQSGVKYDIQLDYYSNGGSNFAGVHLRWMSPSQSKVIVPSNRLYPTSGASSQPPLITSSSVAFGYLGQLYSTTTANPPLITVTASNSPTSFALVSGTLPAGLSLNTATGAITGTPTVAGIIKSWSAPPRPAWEPPLLRSTSKSSTQGAATRAKCGRASPLPRIFTTSR